MDIKYQRHPLSAVFPSLSPSEFKRLKQSVADNGFREPTIYLIDNQIADGWHRYRAAVEIDVVDQLQFVELDVDDPASFVVDCNLTRRHVNKGLDAIIVCEAFGWVGNGSNQDSFEDMVAEQIFKTDEQLAEIAGCGLPHIQRAKTVIRAGRADEVHKGDSLQSVIWKVRDERLRKEKETERIKKEFVRVAETEWLRK